MRARAPARLSAALALLTLALAALSLMAGRVWVPWSAWTSWGADPRWAIVFELRAPRTILGILVGTALGASGAALQGYTRNPLADPGMLGVSACAAFGAVLTFYVAGAPAFALPAMAMAAAGIGLLLLLGLAGGASSMVTFILAGAVLQTLAAAATALALNLAPSPWAVGEIINWMMGALADRSYTEVWLSAPFIAAGLALILTLGRDLDALTLGETGARALGVNLSALRFRLALGVALVVGASTAVTGVVSFVGLMTPHMVRPLVGARPGAILLPSALAGAALVLAADILVRLTPSAAEVKLGVAMAVLGGPFFLALLIRLRRRLA